jgi:hypothetical protein
MDDHREFTLPAMTRRSGFLSIAAIHFHACSEAVIDPKVLRFSAWPAGLQRERTLAMPEALDLKGRC